MKCIRVCGETKDDSSFLVDRVLHEQNSSTIENDDWNTITQVMRIRGDQPEQENFTYIFPFVLEDDEEESNE